MIQQPRGQTLHFGGLAPTRVSQLTLTAVRSSNSILAQTQVTIDVIDACPINARIIFTFVGI